MSWKAGVVKFGIEALGQVLGYNAVTKGISQASDIAKSQLKSDMRLQDDFLALLHQFTGEGADLRKAQFSGAEESLKELRSFAGSAPGESRFVKEGFTSGSKDIMSELSLYGLGNSNVSSDAIGELMSKLLTSEEQAKIGVRQDIVGGAPNLIGASVGLAQNITELQSQKGSTRASQAQLALMQGETTAGFYQNLTGTAEDLGELYYLSKMFGKK